MNNRDKAAYIIENYGLNCTKCNERKDICDLCGTRARIAVEELGNAGLLAPDLPEGYEDTDEDGQIVVFRHGNVVARLDLGDVWDEEAGRSYWPDEARQHAYDLLAAADRAEGKQ